MRKIISAILRIFLVCACCAPAMGQTTPPTFLFLLESNGGPAGPVHAFSVNPTTGALSEAPGSPYNAGFGPQQLAVDPTGRFLYIVNQTSQDITGYLVDPSTGALTPLPGSAFLIGTPANPANPVTAGLDPTGRFLYVFAGTTAPSGISQESLFEYTIDPVSGALKLTSSSPTVWEPAQGDVITSIAFSPAGNVAYLGQTPSGANSGAILVCSVDSTTGNLTQIAFTQPASVESDHLTVAPAGNFLYSTSRPNEAADAFVIGPTGLLSEISEPPYPVGNFPAAILVHPSGKFLYVVNENQAYQTSLNSSQYAGSISAYSITTGNGMLTPVAASPFAAGINAASIAVDPTGSFAYVVSTNYVTGTYKGFAQIQGFSIDSSHGVLSPFPAAAWTDSAQSIATQLVISIGATQAPNPVPTISSFFPQSVEAAGPAFTLQINGTNFVPGSTAYFGGQLRNATFVSPTQLSMSILAGDIANEGTAVVSVFNPLPGGGASNSLEFTVASPIPSITSLSPTSVVMGSSDAGINVGGANFLPSSTVNFNGSPLPATIYVAATLLRVVIPPADIVSAGTATITVTNPSNGGVGGGTSNSFTLGIVPPAAKFSVTSISPTTAQAGGPAFTLTVNGTGFVAASQGGTGTQVSFNLINEPTTYVSSTQLTVAIPATAIAIAGNPYVIVTNPDGTTSAPLTFIITTGNPISSGNPDYSVSADPLISAGRPANFTLTISPLNGSFSNPVLLAISGGTPLPAGATASFAPSATITPGATAKTVMLSITTQPHTAATSFRPLKRQPPALPGLCFVSAIVALILVRRRFGGVQSRRFAAQFLLALLLLIAGGMAACGGLASGPSSDPQPNPSTGTPAGTYPITVTATSGSVSHSATVTLNVM